METAGVWGTTLFIAYRRRVGGTMVLRPDRFSRRFVLRNIDYPRGVKRAPVVSTQNRHAP